MRYITGFLFLSLLIVSACSSSDEKKRLEGERISILDLQKELKPSLNKKNIKITVPEASNNTSWPQNGGYAHHSMQNLQLGPIEQIEKIWESSIGTGSTNAAPLTARPVVGDGRVYTLDTRLKVRAFHDQTGRLLWESDVKHLTEEDIVIAGGLSYDGGAIFVTNGYNEVLALSAQDGKILWRSKIKAASRAAPTIKEDRVFVTMLNNNVAALDVRTGEILWEYEGIGETTGLLGAASPAADDSIVLAALSSGDLIALRLENGATLWTDTLSNVNPYSGITSLSDIRGMPILSGDVALGVSYGGKMAAIEKQSGNRLWQANISSGETPWIAGEVVYVVSADSKLIALSIYNGDILWIKDLQKFANEEKRKNPLLWMGPVMAGGRLILVSNDGRVIEHNPVNGEETASWSVKRPVGFAPILAAGTLFILSDDGRLLAYR